MPWVRRHPILTGLFVLVFVGLYALALAAEKRAGAITVVTFLLLAVFGLLALITYLVGAWRRWRGRSDGGDALSTVAVPSTPPLAVLTPPIVAPMPLAEVPPATVHVPLGLGDMLAMSPTEFEQLCTRVLLTLGYEDVVRSGGSGDLNADITAKDALGRATVVQCKRYAPGSSVGTPALQTFIGMVHVHHRAERGIFMTTAQYSQPAVEFAREHGIVIVDGAFLVKLLDLASIR